MKQKYIHKIDVLLESVRAHMNLLLGELNAGLDPNAFEQLTRLEKDVKVIRITLDEGLKDETPEEKEEKK